MLITLLILINEIIGIKINNYNYQLSIDANILLQIFIVITIIIVIYFIY